MVLGSTNLPKIAICLDGSISVTGVNPCKRIVMFSFVPAISEVSTQAYLNFSAVGVFQKK